jgi:hypothetical protein
LATTSYDDPRPDLEAKLQDLADQALRFATVIDNISQGNDPLPLSLTNWLRPGHELVVTGLGRLGRDTHDVLIRMVLDLRL